MIWTPENDVRLEASWHRGSLYAVGSNRRMDMLLNKAKRQDEIWEVLDRWLNPVRWFDA